MTTLHIRSRIGRRTSTLGLALSLGLIFGADGIIRLTAAERERGPIPVAPVAETCDGEAPAQRVDSSKAAGVHFQGQPEAERNL